MKNTEIKMVSYWKLVAWTNADDDTTSEVIFSDWSRNVVVQELQDERFNLKLQGFKKFNIISEQQEKEVEIDTSISYSSTIEVSNKMNETNDCMVKAMSIALDVPYKEVHKELKLAGRKNRSGTYDSQARKAIKILCEKYGKRFVESEPRNLYSRVKGGEIIAPRPKPV